MDKEEVREKIVAEFRQKQSMAKVGMDENYFEAGVSSLTIIELQMKVEETLGLSMPTSDLMRLSTMSEWVDAYAERAETEPAS